MRKIFVSIALLLLMLCGCAADQGNSPDADDQDEKAVSSIREDPEETEDPEDLEDAEESMDDEDQSGGLRGLFQKRPGQSKEPTFEEAAILKVEPASKTDDFWDYWKVTNNSDKLLSSVWIHVGYYDNEGTMIDDTTVGNDSGVPAGQSVLIRSACSDDYTAKKVYGYYYEYPNVAPGDIFRTELNFITQEITIYTE